MQVNLRENEIAKAVEMYLKHHGLNTRGKTVTVQFSMGKGANGLRTEVNIEGLDDPVEIPGFTSRDQEVDIPLQLLDMVVTEEVRPGTLGALIQNHTEEVQADICNEDQLLMAIGNDEGVMELVPEPEGDTSEGIPPWTTEEAATIEHITAIAAAEPEITDSADDVGLEVPAEVEAPDHPAEAVADPVEEVHVEAVAEVVEAEPAPVEAKPVRRPIFGKKPAPLETLAQETGNAGVLPDEGAGSLIPEDVPAAVVVDAAKTGPVRRSTSLFKKPAA